ncbi:MAG: hypothetical protein ISS35_04340 [Kiritimatiellae bacterium]|nr:hypothetical protein [Kiritimatiellia bacterium]
MQTVERQNAGEIWNKGEEAGEGLGAVAFLMLSVCVTLIILIGAIVLSQGPTVVKPF